MYFLPVNWSKLYGLTLVFVTENKVWAELLLCLTLIAVIAEKWVSDNWINRNERQDFEAISASLSFLF